MAGKPENTALAELMEEYSMDILRHPEKRAFLVAYSEYGTVKQAAEIAGIARQTHYQWMADPDYAKAFQAAELAAAQRLEQEARRRAVEGTDKPVFYKGEQCGTIREYSDTLLIFLLKGAMPEKYKERFEGSISGSVSVELEGLSRDELRAQIAELEQKRLLKEAIDVTPTTICSVEPSKEDDSGNP